MPILGFLATATLIALASSAVSCITLLSSSTEKVDMLQHSLLAQPIIHLA
jgi:hypothetical protein